MKPFEELLWHLKRWIRWRRIRRGVTWGVRGLSLGLLLALLWGTVGLMQGWFLREEFLLFIALVSLTVTLVSGGCAALWPLPHLQSAREFDRAFHLRERISTALELHQTPGVTWEELQRLQLADALAAARRVHPYRDLPLRIRPFEIILPILLSGLLLYGYAQSGSFFQAAQQARQVQAAIQEQSQTIQEILQQVETNPTLSEEQKKALTAPLQQALDELQTSPDLERSVSVLVSAGEKLQTLADPRVETTAQALQQAGQQAAAQENSPLQAVGEQLTQGKPTNAATELLKLDPAQLSAEETKQLAEQLREMAQAVQQSNPQLAHQLNQAAQALERGDATAAQQALNQAAQSMLQVGQGQAMNQAAGQAATQMQQGAQQILAAGGGNQTAQAGASGQQNLQSDAGAGSGRGSGDNPNAQGGPAGSNPIPQNNAPGDGGETTYEQIYAPSLLGGDGGPQVGVSSGNSQDGQVLGQTPSNPSDPSQSLVPYTEVLGQYEEINRRAIETGQIPLQFTQIIRRYFDSLKP
ncbi:MAG: hypothetical protein DDG60_15965 [Anaerolineae bacterium]|nr:MAG: hypothetical protein DDG60_15965 [Anaerolineae bacterium]